MNKPAGKTYSLLDNSTTSDEYFMIMRELTNAVLASYNDDKNLLLELIRSATKRRSDKTHHRRQGILVDDQSLSKYTRAVNEHLKNISFFQRFDPIIRTTEAQYHLYMLEIELVNRLYKDLFLKSDFRMALFPHCLRDFRSRCLSQPGDIDHLCLHCTKECYIHWGSELLIQNKIHPYIAITMDQEKMFRKLLNKYRHLGVIGIACVPELVRGMRLCMKLGISPIGVPLDVNCCSRWMGQAYETSFNKKQLESLIKEEV